MMIYATKAQFDFMPARMLEAVYSNLGPYGISFDSYIQNLAKQATRQAKALVLNCPLFPSRETRIMHLPNRMSYLPLAAYLAENPVSIGISAGIGQVPSYFEGSSYDRDPMHPDRLLFTYAGPGLYFIDGIWALLDWKYTPLTCTLDAAVLAGESTATKTETTDQFEAGDVLYDKASGSCMIVASNDGTDLVFDDWGLPTKDIADEAILYCYGSLNQDIEKMVLMESYLQAYLEIGGGHKSGFDSEKADLHSYKRRGTGSYSDSLSAQYETHKDAVLALRPEDRPI